MKPTILYLLLIVCFIQNSAMEKDMGKMEKEMENEDPPLKYLPVKQPNGSFQLEDLSIINILPTATENDVKFYLYTPSNPENPIQMNATNENLIDLHFNTETETMYLTHGWHSDYTAPVVSVIRKAVLKKYNVNVIAVDWSIFADKSYVTAYVNIPTIGKIIGNFLITLSKKYNYPLSQVRGVGHSLGAHVIGVSGKTMNGALKSIVGLDPAGPLFTIINTKNRLTQKDARYVQIIHTCGKLLGYYPPCGDSDFYPNGGLSQPGCNIVNDRDGLCSHQRAYELYAETISVGGFTATRCSNYYISYQLGLCKGDQQIQMGGFILDTSAKGKYYLNTRATPPYVESN